MTSHRKWQFAVDHGDIDNPVEHGQILRQAVAKPQNEGLAALDSLQGPQKRDQATPEEKGHIEFRQRRRQHQTGNYHGQEFANHIEGFPSCCLGIYCLSPHVAAHGIIMRYDWWKKQVNVFPGGSQTTGPKSLGGPPPTLDREGISVYFQLESVF